MRNTEETGPHVELVILRTWPVGATLANFIVLEKTYNVFRLRDGHPQCRWGH